MEWTKILAATAAVIGASGCVYVEDNSTVEPRVTAPMSMEAKAGDYEAALAPYYAQLEAELDLPSAPQSPVLDGAATLTRIAIGSCNHQWHSQDIWPVIAATNPQVFLAIGDNVYGDVGYKGEADLGSFRAAYAQQATDPAFRALVSSVPTFATWDDHDYGPNDAGGTFAFRQFSETLFENFWNSDSATISRPGVYSHVAAGPDGQRVQIIMLDTRFFRSPLNAMPYQTSRPPLGGYLPDPSPDAEVLGVAQWEWLSEVLAEPADLRIMVSSIQVLTDAHNYESWENFPLQREKLYRTLAAREDSGLVLVSGDRHSGAIYTDHPAALGEKVWELTSSSLNLAFVRSDASEGEPDARRTTAMITEENFGLIDIDWSKREVALRILDDKGSEFVSQTVGF